MLLDDDRWADLLHERATRPAAAGERLRSRRRRPLLGADGRLFIVAADHTARGMLGVGDEPFAMVDRRRLLENLLVSLAHPGVDGVLGSPDVLEELALLGALDGKLAFGTMNRGGIMGARWELDDRMTAYDAESIANGGLDGGKVLLRIADDDSGTAPTLEACAQAVSALARRRLPIMVEPLPYHITEDGSAKLLDDDDKLLRAVAVAAGLGTTTSYTWLKVPAGRAVRRMLSVTTLPALILGGSPGPDPEATFASWEDGDDGAQRCGGWSSVGPSCTRPTATSPRRSGGRPASCVRKVPAMGDLHRPAGSLVAGSDPVALTPDEAGWTHAGLRVLALAEGEVRVLDTGRDEVGLLPLSVTDLVVEAEGQRFTLDGRLSVFARVTDFAYIGRDTRLTLTAERAGEVAVATARCQEHRPPRYGAAEDVAIEMRGAGPSTRQVDQLPQPGRLARRRAPDVRRAAHPGRQLVLLPAAQARRLAGVPGEQRGDLLLPDRSGWRHLVRDRRASACTASTRRRRHRRHRRGARWRRLPRAAGLPRSVRRGPRLHDVLPERPRRSGPRTIDGVLRRPGAPLGA